MKRSTVALSAAAAGAIGLGVLAVPAGADSQPDLPDVSAEALVESVLAAETPALGGTVEIDNGLGLPTLPGMGGPESPLTLETSTFRVWSDGEGRGRLTVPSNSGEDVVVADGDTLWHYDSGSRTATAVEDPEGGAPEGGQDPTGLGDELMPDPAEVATALIGAVRSSSTVSVDGTAEVAGRPAYELVLTPAPTERTLLREVRVAVDSESRLPLRLTVLTNGSDDPALEVGFADLEVGPQDPALFEFTPPDGVTVQRPELPDAPSEEDMAALAALGLLRVEGDGWDTVLVSELPIGSDELDGEGAGYLDIVRQIGRPASGEWGEGWVVQTAVGTVLVASDGRIAAGAVPQQVLAEALAQ